MTALLDTCVVLWAARQPERLSARVRALLLDPNAELTVRRRLRLETPSNPSWASPT